MDKLRQDCKVSVPRGIVKGKHRQLCGILWVIAVTHLAQWALLTEANLFKTAHKYLIPYIDQEYRLARRYPYLFRQQDKNIKIRDMFASSMVPVYDQLDRLTNNDTYSRQNTVESHLYTMERLMDFENLFKRDHSYSDPQDLAQSAQPVANQTLCSEQLSWLRDQIVRNTTTLFEKGRNNIALMNYLDSFGRPESGSYQGNTYWFGSYEQCLNSKIDYSVLAMILQSGTELLNNAITPSPNTTRASSTVADNVDSTSPRLDTPEQPAMNIVERFGQIRGRYCLAKMRANTWPKEDNSFLPRTTIKLGLCLPETCDTSSLNDYSTLITDLALTNFATLYQPRYQLVDMYCLPDERSPVRRISIYAYLYVSFILLWLVSVLVCTIVYRYKCGLAKSKILKGPVNEQKPDDYEDLMNKNKLSTFRILYNLLTNQSNTDGKLDLAMAPTTTTTTTPTPTPTTETAKSDQQPKQTGNFSSPLASGKNDSVHGLIHTLSLDRTLEYLATTYRYKAEARINMVVVDSVKVIFTFITLACHTVSINEAIFKSSSNVISGANRSTLDLFTIVTKANDTFFLLGGILAGYLTMKNLEHCKRKPSILLRPTNWFNINLRKFLRLTPVYLITYWYSKFIAVHMSAGPVWDYGTDVDSYRGLCMRSEWFRSILYFASTGESSPLCGHHQWFVVSYVQIFLVLPLLIFAIIKFHKWNIPLIASVIVACSAYNINKMRLQSTVDPSLFSRYPSAASLIMTKYAWTPYRGTMTGISVVALGTLAGYYLCLYEKKQIVEWPKWMRTKYLKLACVLHLTIAMLPIISKCFLLVSNLKIVRHLHLSKAADVFHGVTVGNSIIQCILQPIWLILHTIILLRLISDLNKRTFVGRILSHDYWTIVNKLTFCIYMVHYEVIYYSLATQYDTLSNRSMLKVAKDITFVAIMSLVISFCLYITFESPLDRLMKAIVSKRRVSHLNSSQLTACDSTRSDKNSPSVILPRVSMTDHTQ